jgi:hypothetical protein
LYILSESLDTSDVKQIENFEMLNGLLPAALAKGEKDACVETSKDATTSSVCNETVHGPCPAQAH